MRLSVVIPARNEEGNIALTVNAVSSTLRREGIGYEIIVVDDGSTDHTGDLVREISLKDRDVHLITNSGRHGFGMAVQVGLQHATGDVIAIMMADCSDSPEDLVAYYRKTQEGYDCVFGSRFISGSVIVDYPAHKLLLNRLANHFIRFRYSLKAARPLNGMTARSVSRSFRRSPESRVLISCGTALSDEKPSMLLLSQADAQS